MAEYALVREIQNLCRNNQMRDVFFDEIETDDPMAAVKAMLKDESAPVLTLEKHNEGNFTIYAECSGITQRFLFTKI